MSKPPMPIANVLYQLQPARGVTGEKYLSTNGKNVDLWHEDDDSGRQKWRFTSVGNNLFNIRPFAGVGDRNILSNNGQNVDLWVKDDGSGRQKWELIPLNNGAFHIKGGAKFLSTNGKNVDLWESDDNSGRQQWQLVPEDIQVESIDFDIAKADQIPLPSFIVKQTINNNSDVQQESKVTFKKKATDKSSYQHEHGFTFSVEAEATFGTPMVSSGSVKVSTSTSHTWTYGSEESREDSRIYEMPVKIPPHSTVVAKATVTQMNLDVDYTARGISKLTGETIESSGKWNGVSAGEIIYSIDQH